ncbi:MAG: archaeal proteasome endopeptidase complex subunit alpha [Halobacteria archaeon]|nr:archaeal proteasome endopeptidase complex subunit alpha [Halobacteria archaeon]
MQQQNEQMAYDRGSTIFSPDGRLYQVEYAREAVKRGSASIGVKTSEGVVLIAEKRVSSDLLVSDSIEKIYQIDDHIAVAASGHVADARQLVDFARVESQRNTYMYEEPLDTRTLAKSLGDHIQQYTQYGGTRPFGCALLIGGVTADGEEIDLIESEPSGAIIGYKAAGIGEKRAEVEEKLQEGYSEDMTTEDGLRLALSALDETEDDVSVENIEAMAVEADGVRTVSKDEIEDSLPEEFNQDSSDDESEPDEEEEE